MSSESRSKLADTLRRLRTARKRKKREPVDTSPTGLAARMTALETRIGNLEKAVYGLAFAILSAVAVQLAGGLFK